MRSLYRDIASLQQQGADISGEPGLGYDAQTWFYVAAFDVFQEEIEALVLGSRWVADRGDERLALGQSALQKSLRSCQSDLRINIDTSTLHWVGDQNKAHFDTALHNTTHSNSAEHKVKTSLQ